MKNLRILTITPAEQVTFNPVIMVERMLAAGFNFDHIGCPVKIAQPWDRIEEANGNVVYRQWDAS